MGLLNISRSRLKSKKDKMFTNFMPINIIQNTLNGGDLDLLFEEANNDENFENSQTETETFESTEELKYTRE